MDCRSPVGGQKVAHAYRHEADSDFTNKLSGGLRKAWEIIDSQIAWLCGEAEQASRGAEGDWLIRAHGQASEVAAQHVLVAGCHSEILPACSTPTCQSVE